MERIGFYATAERMNGIYKFINILESLVHRGVAQIRHFIDGAEFFEHFRANRRRLSFASAGFQLMHNLIHHLFQGKETGGTFFESFRDATSQFAPVEDGAVATRLTASTFRQLVESRDAQFGALAGVAFAEGIVVREPVQRPGLLKHAP